MTMVHTTPRQLTISFVRPGDELAAWVGGGLCAMWRDHYQHRAEWLAVQNIAPEDPEAPLGTQTVTFQDGQTRPVEPHYFVVVRESVQVPDELLCTCA